jgi:hypothetical protein
MRVCNCTLAGTAACRTCPNGYPNFGREFTFFPEWPTYRRPQTESGWVCPKCGSVYGPSVLKCDKCNEKI